MTTRCHGHDTDHIVYQLLQEHHDLGGELRSEVIHIEATTGDGDTLHSWITEDDNMSERIAVLLLNCPPAVAFDCIFSGRRYRGIANIHLCREAQRIGHLAYNDGDWDDHAIIKDFDYRGAPTPIFDWMMDRLLPDGM